MLRLFIKCSFGYRVKEIMKNLGMTEQCAQVGQIIDQIRKEQYLDHQNADYLIQLIAKQCEKEQLIMLDKLITPSIQLKEKQIKDIESIMISKTSPLSLSIYGKLKNFFHYRNEELLTSLISKVNFSALSADELSAAAIGLGLIQSNNANIWKQIKSQTLQLKKTIHQHMRIATGVGLANMGDAAFWQSFAEHLIGEIPAPINEDVFSQSIQVISQQDSFKLNKEQVDIIEKYFLENLFTAANTTSIIASMARMKLGSQDLYEKLDIYSVELYGDDLAQFVVELLKVKHLLSGQTINQLLARAYAESTNPDLLGLISMLIQQPQQ